MTSLIKRSESKDQVKSDLSGLKGGNTASQQILARGIASQAAFQSFDSKSMPTLEQLEQFRHYARFLNGLVAAEQGKPNASCLKSLSFEHKKCTSPSLQFKARIDVMRYLEILLQCATHDTILHENMVDEIRRGLAVCRHHQQLIKLEFQSSTLLELNATYLENVLSLLHARCLDLVQLTTSNSYDGPKPDKWLHQDIRMLQSYLVVMNAYQTPVEALEQFDRDTQGDYQFCPRSYAAIARATGSGGSGNPEIEWLLSKGLASETLDLTSVTHAQYVLSRSKKGTEAKVKQPAAKQGLPKKAVKKQPTEEKKSKQEQTLVSTVSDDALRYSSRTQSALEQLRERALTIKATFYHHLALFHGQQFDASLSEHSLACCLLCYKRAAKTLLTLFLRVLMTSSSPHKIRGVTNDVVHSWFICVVREYREWYSQNDVYYYAEPLDDEQTLPMHLLPATCEPVTVSTDTFPCSESSVAEDIVLA